jgi:putative glutamine amidotransferase
MTGSAAGGMAPAARVADEDRRTRPVVGVPVPIEDARWRVWSDSVHLLNAAYGDHLRRAGAIPVLLPVGGPAEEAATLMRDLDGLMIAGGADVEPSRYGSRADPAAGPFDPGRDAWELALLDAALELGRPVFGICRGMQLLNVRLGGTLRQDLPGELESDIHLARIGQFGSHPVEIASDSRLAAVLGPRANVPTYHHQAVGAVGAGLTPVAWAPDGTVEALEDETGRLLAVQWHPEVDRSNDVFAYFAARCASAREERA